MFKTDLHSELAVIDQDLNNPVDLVDSRSVTDQLNFISKFAELINFYNKDNELSGNWNPFILKDPVFLAAQISQSPWKKAKDKFNEYCEIADKLFAQGKMDDLKQVLKKLFSEIVKVFTLMETWTANMLVASDTNDLKSYLLNNVKDTYSAIFWAIVELGTDLVLSGYLDRPVGYDADRFSDFNDLIWMTNKERRPYWEVLKCKKSKALQDNPDSLIKTLKTNGNDTFSFYKAVVEMAQRDLTAIGQEITPFPDTLLLRTFIQLLENNKADLNALTAKHLDFYYSDILKQVKSPAVADQVYVSAKLSETKTAFSLPEGTCFTAGTDAQSNPILFELGNSLSLNPGQISQGYTLLVREDKDTKAKQLFLNEIKTPSKLKTAEDGSVQGWNTFGTTNETPEVLGIAFASPMLFLSEGIREINFTFTFSDDIVEDFFTCANLYLSTAKDWLLVNDKIQPITSEVVEAENVWQLNLKLDVTDPAIENFTKPLDGYTSEWPLFKMEFSQFCDVKTPPQLTQLDITTAVSGIKSLTISNDNGALNASKPFQLFGPIADQGKSFYMGNAEIFSKKLSFLNLELDWDKLEADFETYYDLYNKYLHGELVPEPSDDPPSSKWWPDWLTTIASKSKDLAEWIAKKIRQRKEEEEEAKKKPIFDNQAFKVNFSLLSNGSWIPAGLNRMRDCETDGAAVSCETPYVTDTPGTPGLFNSEKDKPEHTVSTTFYSYQLDENQDNALPYDSDLQQVALAPLAENTISGFLRMTLTDPDEGFGNAIYPKIISTVALLNADAIVKATTSGGTPTLTPQPNPPFVPMLKSLVANYTATETFDFNYGTQDAPIQCYHYSVFENYLVYDSTADSTSYQNQIGVPIFGKNKLPVGLPVYPRLDYNGVLWMEMTQVIAPNPISFFLELSESPFRNQEKKFELSYFYLSESGWGKLDVLSDETKGFTCSGTITFDFPKEWTEDTTIMPKAFWWGIGLTGDTNAVAQTVFLDSNGFKLTRTGSNFEWDTEKPTIAANQVTGPEKAIPELASVMQPFPSFGGKGAEDDTAKNLRISSRLKHKDRAVTSDDYGRIINQNFDSIFYSKINFNKKKRTVDIHLVKKVEDQYAANAFLPLVNKCLEENVTDLLMSQANYDQISVKNFNLKYVTVNATVFIRPEFELKGTAKRITQALKVFLSPWIQSTSDQITIDQGISDVQVARFLNDFYEVVSVEDIEFQLSSNEDGTKKRDGKKTTSVHFKDPGLLMVPDNNQAINWKSAV